MRIALGIVKLFPEGGLQRDCIRLARALSARGHEVTLFTSAISGPIQLPCRSVVLPVRAFTNHRTDLRFARRFAAATKTGFDRVVGFNKLIDLDFYYCADPCILERGRTPLEQTLPRHRVQTMLEEQSFGPFRRTHILALTRASAESYRRVWLTPEHRITVLQPSIDPARLRSDLRTSETRTAMRSQLGIPQDRRVWLWVGAQALIKGLDRVLTALASEPDTTLLVVGLSPTKGQLAAIGGKVGDLNLTKVKFLGFREDVAELMAAADVLVHPSRLDVTGQVILEAIVNGLPAVVSGACGFAELVEQSGAGLVLPEPFEQADFEAALARLRDPARAAAMSEAGIRYGRDVAPVSGLEQAADAIERGAAFQAVPATPHGDARSRPPRRYAPISVILTTYNRPDALDAVLRGLSRQTARSFEIIVADDGSSPETTARLARWRSRLQQPLIHVWQQHRGFRAAEIRNRAILASSGAYCIFLDGDCIPRADFVMAHRALAEPGWFVVGNRVLMSNRLTERVLLNALEPETWTFGQALRARLEGDINRLAPLLQAKFGPVRKIWPRYWLGARSCNLAVWRSDLDRVDGFDASYVGWGLEDSDLLVRLLRAGVQRKDGRFATGVLHLWHPLADPSLLSTNQALLQSVLQGDRITAALGLSTLQQAAEQARAGQRIDGTDGHQAIA